MNLIERQRLILYSLFFKYSYYNLKFRRNEVTSIELFEGTNQYNSTHFSSFDAIKPVIVSKSYIIQKSFDSMQLTLTEKGITTKDIIGSFILSILFFFLSLNGRLF